MFKITQQRAHLYKILPRLVLALLLLAMAGVATAKPTNITEAEMKLIPSYCPDTMGFKYGDANFNTSPRAGHWVALMGKGFWAMHHYCWAQINMNRAQRAGVSAQIRQGLRESARGDYEYVINNTPPDFVLLPEIYTRIGSVELLLKHPDMANKAFARARALKADYWPAYSHWAEFLMKIGHRTEALKIVASGLAYSPGAKVLLEQFRLLGGKPSNIPKPAEKPQGVTESPTDSTPSVPINPVTPESERGEE